MTLSDVAAAAGVSPSTASRVLNGGKPVSADLEHRVRSAAAQIGYVSNAAASAMRGRSGLLAILTDELGAEALAELAIAAGAVATAAGLTTSVSSAGARPSQQILAIRVLRSLRPRAVVLTGGWISDPAIRPALEQELAEYVDRDEGVVVVMGPDVLPYPTVGFDDFGDGAAVARHLAAGGGRRALVLAGPRTHGGYRARAEGMLTALREAGVDDVRVVHTANESDHAEAGVLEHAVDAAPDLLLCVSDRLALGAYAALDGLGLRIPEDVAICGIDDIPVASQLTPGLTTVAHPLLEAGELVVSMATSGEADAAERRVLPGSLVVRESSRRVR
ncbi:LacI family DNA-binding transcriptional regulator [Microbacterium sp. NPDC055683]